MPKIKSRSEAANKIATTGNKVRLSCAVTSFNEKEQHDAKYVWTKNGKPVIEGWRLRIRKLKYLRIKKVEENDAGRYQCIVSDQDGQDSIVINLYVVGKHSVQSHSDNCPKIKFY